MLKIVKKYQFLNIHYHISLKIDKGIWILNIIYSNPYICCQFVGISNLYDEKLNHTKIVFSEYA